MAASKAAVDPVPRTAPGLLPRPLSMQCLESALPMDCYRERPTDEMDLVQWPQQTDNSNNGDSNATNDSSDSSVGLSQPTPVHLRSKNSNRAAYVLFVNNTSYRVRTLWLNYKGEEVVYDILEPGVAVVQGTYATHPWIVRELSTSTRLLINNQEAFVPHKQSSLSYQPIPHSEALDPDEAVAEVQAALAAYRTPAAAPAAMLDTQVNSSSQQQQQQRPEPWVQVYATRGFRRMPFSSLQQAVITELPQLSWSIQSHSYFPEDFKTVVRTFLLCYQTLHDSVAADLAAGSEASHSNNDQQQQQQQHVESSSSSSSSSATHLGHLPHLLLSHILAFAAPFHPQSVGLPQELRPDIKPALLHEKPPRPARFSHGYVLPDPDDEDDEDGEQFEDFQQLDHDMEELEEEEEEEGEEEWEDVNEDELMALLAPFGGEEDAAGVDGAGQDE